MTNFEKARRFAGINAVNLAKTLDVSPQQLNSWISGVRVPNRNNVEGIAKTMGVDAAWLLGVPQTLAVYSPVDNIVFNCPIMYSEPIQNYGIFYIVWVEDLSSWLPVIVGNAVQFTPRDWDNAYNAKNTNEIQNTNWIDSKGNDAIIIDGLPRMIA